MKMIQIIITIFLLFSSTAHAVDSGAAMYICQGISNEKEQNLCVSRATQTINDIGRVVPSRESKGMSLGFFSIFWPWAWWFLYYGFGILIGLYLFKDSKSREWIFLGIRPILWLLLAAFNPGLTLIAYWLMHYSRFSMSYSEAIATVRNPVDKEQ